MPYFLKSGSRFTVTTKQSMDLHERLPVGTYTVRFDRMSETFYLEAIDGFEVKGKIYGDTTRTAGRIMNTFKSRSGSTGVMLSGEKGSGKTLLAKVLSENGIAENVPTIVINNPWHGEVFNGFMQMIEQETIVIFDEFEKVYDKDAQEGLLTLLDGVYPSKKLFIITCNDKWRVNEHMRNRPGRIFYRIDYAGLDTAFITDYCEDNLNDKSQIEPLCHLAVMFNQFNFDILKAMVEEMNRYNESPQDAMKMLNAKPELSDKAAYEITVVASGKEIPKHKLGGSGRDGKWSGNPLASDGISLYYYKPTGKTDEDGDEVEDYQELRFDVSDLKHVDADTGDFRFESRTGTTMTLSKVQAKMIDYGLY